MKIIDLLNKIAKGEEVPKKIRVRGVYHPDYDENDKSIDVEDMTIWYLDDSYFDYDYYSEGEIGERKDMFETFLINRILNNEVEIIEEDKKIKKLVFNKDQDGDIIVNGVSLIEKVNEIIDIINKEK